MAVQEIDDLISLAGRSRAIQSVTPEMRLLEPSLIVRDSSRPVIQPAVKAVSSEVQAEFAS
jgi:hypothetical protein